MMLLLLDTTNAEARVALANGHDIIEQRSWLNNPNVGLDILKAIDDLLVKNNVVWPDVKRLAACAAGSRNYSTLRTGVLIAALLAYAYKTELVSVTGAEPNDLISQAASASPVDFIKPTYTTNHLTRRGRLIINPYCSSVFFLTLLHLLIYTPSYVFEEA